MEKNKKRKYVRLAAIPQPRADGLPFQTAQATPKIAAVTEKKAAFNRLGRARSA
jgi:hypothetical protein